MRGLRVVVALGPVAAVAVSGLGSELPPAWMWVLVVALSVGHAAAPESDLGVLAVLSVLAWWTLGPAADDGVPLAALLAAVALVLAHVAALVTSYGPASRTPDPRLLLTWAARAALAASAAVPVWLLAVVVEGRRPPVAWEVGLAALALALVGAGVVLRDRPAPPAGPAPSGRSQRVV